MSARIRFALFLLLVTFGSLVLAFLALVFTGPEVPERTAPVFDLEVVRKLAGRGGPAEIRAAKVSAGEQRQAFLVVGGSWEKREMPVYAVELVWPGRGGVVIDPSTDADCAEGFLPTVFFDAAAYQRMQDAMGRAADIVATHEHFDHVCGLTRSPQIESLAAAARLTEAQLDSDPLMTGVDDRSRRLFTPLVYDHQHRLAPGVVLIAAPGHTPGSQWVYIRTASGAEWLLVGDTVWTHESLEQELSKPWLPVLFGGEDADAQSRYVRFLADFERDHPEVQVMIAHETAQWERALASGGMSPL